MLISAFFISGCAKIERELDFKGNGLIGIRMTAVVQEDVIKLAYKSVDDFYAQSDSQFSTGYYLNFKVSKIKTTIKDSDAYGYSIEGSAPEMIIEKLFTSDDMATDIEQSGFIKRKIKITLTSKKQPQQNNNQSNNGSFDDLANGITDSMMGMISDTFIVTVPGKILSTNGYEDMDDAHKVTWDIASVEMGDTPSKVLEVTYLNTRPIVIFIVLAIICILLLAGIFLIVFFVLKKSKKNGKRKQKRVKSTLNTYLARFENDGGKILYDVYIPGVNGIVGKIDAILIHDSGLYLFDRMNKEGWISGKADDDYWIQTDADEVQNNIMNPVKQTLKQTEWLKKNVKNIMDVYSVIVFPENSNLNSTDTGTSKVKVVRDNNFEDVVESFRGMRGILFEKEIEEMYRELCLYKQ